MKCHWKYCALWHWLIHFVLVSGRLRDWFWIAGRMLEKAGACNPWRSGREWEKRKIRGGGETKMDVQNQKLSGTGITRQFLVLWLVMQRGNTKMEPVRVRWLPRGQPEEDQRIPLQFCSRCVLLLCRRCCWVRFDPGPFSPFVCREPEWHSHPDIYSLRSEKRDFYLRSRFTWKGTDSIQTGKTEFLMSCFSTSTVQKGRCTRQSLLIEAPGEDTSWRLMHNSPTKQVHKVPQHWQRSSVWERDKL